MKVLYFEGTNQINKMLNSHVKEVHEMIFSTPGLMIIDDTLSSFNFHIMNFPHHKATVFANQIHSKFIYYDALRDHFPIPTIAFPKTR